MSESEKRVLAQDRPQYEQSLRVGSTAKRKEAEAQQAEYEREAAQYDKEQREAEEKYQRELAEFTKSQETQIEKNKIEQSYDLKMSQLQEQKKQAVINAREGIEGRDASATRARAEAQRKVEQQYNLKIETLSREKNSVLLPLILKEQGYPQYAIDKATRSYRSGTSLTVGSAVERAERLVKGKEAQAERSRAISVQDAINAPSYTKQQQTRIEFGTEYLSGRSSEDMQSRAQNIKPTPNVITGKQAEDTRRPLINVKTVENIYGGQQIETNPRAFVASLTRQNVTPAGTKEEPKTIFSFQNISDVKEESGRALLEFQSQLKTENAPSASVYRGILIEKGLVETPLAKRIIETYSSKPTKEYKTRAEAFGLEEAKGRKGIISDPLGAKLFDLETGEGSIRIGRLMGFKYSKPVLVSELGKDVQGPVQPQYNISDAFGNPRTDKSDNPILLKSEKAIERVSKNTVDKPSSLIIPTMKGPIELKVEPPKKSSLGAEIERGLIQFEADSQWLQKNPKSKNLLLAAYQTIAPIGLATGRSIGSTMAFGVNYAEQTYAPFLAQKLGLKEPKKVAPIQVTDTSGLIVLPVNFDKLDIKNPMTYPNAVLNPLDKEYQSRQTEYIKKYGLLEYASGIVFDYGGLKGGTQLIRSGGKVLVKPILPRIGKAAKSAAIVNTPSSIFKQGERFASPSRMWDVSEAATKVGIRIDKKVPTIPVTTRPTKALPNPFGKEREPFYSVRQGMTKTKDIIQTASEKISKRIPYTTPVLLKNFADISLNPAHLGTRPNIPTRKELSPPSEYTRYRPDFGIMRDIFYPPISPSRPKPNAIPPGFVKVRPKLATAKTSVKKIKVFPSVLAGKIKMPTLDKPEFIKKSQRNWQSMIFMQKKRFEEFKQSLPTLPKPKANQFVTFQRKARDIESGILETKRLSTQLFKWPVAKKTTVPAFTKQELKNITRLGIETPSSIRTIIKSREPRQMSFGVAPYKSPPFMEGFIEKPFRARHGKAPIEISFRSDVSGLGSVTQRPQSFFESRRRFPKAPVEFENILKRTDLWNLIETGKDWDKNWKLKQRPAKSAQEYIYKLEKGEWVEYPVQKGQFFTTKLTRITSERYRQMPKMDLNFPKITKPKTIDLNWRDMADVRREMKNETNMLFSNPKRTDKVNTRLIKSDMNNALSDYFKTATPFQLKRIGPKEWDVNWRQIAKAESTINLDNLSQKRSMRTFGKTEKENMLKGVSGAGASSYGPVGFQRFEKFSPKPFMLEKATTPIQFPIKERQRGPNLDISKEAQERLDKVWGQGMAKVMMERKKGELPSVTTRIQDTSNTIQGKARLSFVSEPLRTTPIVVQRGIGIFDKPISIRKGKLVRGLKPVRDFRGYLPDKFAETRITPKGGKPMSYGYWKPELKKQKEPDSFFKREPLNKYQIFKEDTAIGSITPASILEMQKFTKIELKLGKANTDVFFRKFEKTPINSTKKKKGRTGPNLDIPKESQKRLDKVWDQGMERKKGKGVGQILVPPEPRNPLKLPEPEASTIGSSGESVGKKPDKKGKKGIPFFIPPSPSTQTQEYDEIILSQYRPKASTIQTPKMSIKMSQPQRIENSFKLSTVQPQRISMMQRSETKQKQPTKQREREKYIVLQTPRIKQTQKQVQKLSTPEPFKTPTKQPTRLAQPIKFKQPTIQVLRYREPEPPRKQRPLAALLPKENKIPKSVLQKQNEKADFLGSSSEISISGIFGKRQEITYGQKKIDKLLKGDVRVVQGKKRASPRRATKWKEGKKGDMFGFKNEAKKKLKNKTNFW